MKEEIAQSIANAPESTGVYFFKNAKGDFLYIGKAKNLRARLRSYLRPGGDGRFQLQFLSRQAAAVEFVLTPGEGEALLLEDRLVKQHQPIHNVRLRDDKSFLMLRLDLSKEFPRFEPVRSHGEKEPGYRYFGPYPSSQALRRSLRLLHSLIPMRDCSDSMMKHRSRPCLKHSIGLCAAPCVGLIDAKDYAALVEKAVAVLSGKTAELEKELERKMKKAADELQFERAKVFRDQLKALQQTVERRPVLTRTQVERDTFGFFRNEKNSIVTVLRFRAGGLVDSKSHLVPSTVPEEELLSSFLSRFYNEGEAIPAEIVVPGEIHEREMLERVFSERAEHPVSIFSAQRGEKHLQLKMASANAKEAAAQIELRRDADGSALDRLQERLGLVKRPECMDCFDISQMQGSAMVASRVRFVEGRPNKTGYRHYKIQSVSGQDDFAAMLEVVSRSLRRGLEEDDLPDLIVIDGGKGQLSSALAARDELGAWDVEFVALAKDREKEKEGEKFHTGERVFLPGADQPIALPAGSPERLLMERIRDEAHRFAITFHRKKREAIRSELDEIPGLGAQKKKSLLRHFGSVASIREASVDQIMQISGMNSRLAQSVYEKLRRS